MMIMDKHSYLSNANGEVIEDLYNQYLVNKNDVEEGWRKFFDGFEFARKNYDSDGDEIPLNVKKEFRCHDKTHLEYIFIGYGWV